MFYKEHVNPDFETFFRLEKEEHADFLEFARIIQDLDALDDIHYLRKNFVVRLMVHSKHIMYMACFTFLPLSMELATVSYVSGAATSLLARNLKTDVTGQGFFTNFGSEEETITMGMFLLIALCSPPMRMMILLSVAIWCFINTCEWGIYLAKKGYLPLGSVLLPFMERVHNERVGFVQ